MWKTGWIAQRWLGSLIRYEWVPGFPITSKEPKYFSANFLVGRVDFINLVSMNTRLPTSILGTGVLFLFADSWYQCCAPSIVFLRSLCTTLKSVSQLCHGPVVTYCMVYHYTKRVTLARLLANEGPAIYIVHLNRYFVIPPWYYLGVTFLWQSVTKEFASMICVLFSTCRCILG